MPTPTSFASLNQGLSGRRIVSTKKMEVETVPRQAKRDSNGLLSREDSAQNWQLSPVFRDPAISPQTAHLQRFIRHLFNCGAVEIQLTQRLSEWTLAGGPTKTRMEMRSVVLRTGQLPFLG
jgi:hypothetical protein